jgi:predicted Zn finger-like uncharacterized protein
MILTCPACQTRYTVDATKFPPQGRTVRCARCGNTWHAEAEAPPAFVEPEPEPAPSPAFEAPEPPPREAYAQPEVRDPEPQDSDGADEESPRPPRQPLWHRPLVLKAGWAALAAVVILLGMIASVYRQEVVATWPNTASLYAKLGMKVPGNGLKIGKTENSKANMGGQIVLTVSGTLTNVADRELPVPQIRIGLVDSDKHEVYHWTVAPDVITLKPGQSTRFVTQLSNPPDKAVDYSVRFAKAGE